MKARALRPLPPKGFAMMLSRGTRCAAEVTQQTARWRALNGDGFQCMFPAVVELDGKMYCARHGGEVALRFLISKTEAHGGADDDGRKQG